MIYVLCGPPCAGKSTYIKEHKSESDLVIDYDEIAFCLGGKKYEADGDFKDMAIFLRKSAINRILDGEVKADAWIIDTKPSEASLEAYKNAGAEIITLDVSKDECLARAEQDNRPQSTFDAIDKYFSEEKGRAMDHKYKSFELKAKEDETGMIAGYFSTYDKEPDSYGDIIEKGAFTETIAKRAESGHPFPLCFNHDFSAVIGAVDKIEDTEKGPYIEAHFLDTQQAQDVRKMLQSGAIYQFSFAYDVLGAREPDEEEKKKGIANVLTKVEVFEISVVTVPANQNAVATEIKSGRRNRKSDEDIIRSCIESLKSLLDEGEEDKPEEEEEQTEETQSETNAAAEESKGCGNSVRTSELLEKINQFKGEDL